MINLFLFLVKIFCRTFTTFEEKKKSIHVPRYAKSLRNWKIQSTVTAQLSQAEASVEAHSKWDQVDLIFIQIVGNFSLSLCSSLNVEKYKQDKKWNSKRILTLEPPTIMVHTHK